MKLRIREMSRFDTKRDERYLMIAQVNADGGSGITMGPGVLEYFNPMSEEWEAVEIIPC